jgi:hypothetical protein
LSIAAGRRGSAEVVKVLLAARDGGGSGARTRIQTERANGA